MITVPYERLVEDQTRLYLVTARWRKSGKQYRQEFLVSAKNEQDAKYIAKNHVPAEIIKVSGNAATDVTYKIYDYGEALANRTYYSSPIMPDTYKQIMPGMKEQPYADMDLNPDGKLQAILDRQAKREEEQAAAKAAQEEDSQDIQDDQTKNTSESQDTEENSGPDMDVLREITTFFGYMWGQQINMEYSQAEPQNEDLKALLQERLKFIQEMLPETRICDLSAEWGIEYYEQNQDAAIDYTAIQQNFDIRFDELLKDELPDATAKLHEKLQEQKAKAEKEKQEKPIKDIAVKTLNQVGAENAEQDIAQDTNTDPAEADSENQESTSEPENTDSNKSETSSVETETNAETDQEDESNNTDSDTTKPESIESEDSDTEEDTEQFDPTTQPGYDDTDTEPPASAITQPAQESEDTDHVQD